MHTVKQSGQTSGARYRKHEGYYSARSVMLDTIEKWLYSSVVSCQRPGVYYPGRIGEAILRLSEDDRKCLAKLTSDDFHNVVPHPYFNPNPSELNIRVFRLPHEKVINT